MRATGIKVKACIRCDKKYPKKGGVDSLQFLNSKFCSLKCKGVYQSQYNIGKNNKNYRGGKSICVDCKKELPHRYSQKKEPRCKSCWHKFSIGENAPGWKGGKEYPNCVNCNAKTADWKSVLCRKCYRGKLSPFWRGGTSLLSTLIRALPENRQWQKQCLYRDNYCCLECGIESKGNNLQIHHVKQFALILKENNIKTLEEAKKCEELWDMDNGRTLCRECHKLTENFNKKIN